MRTCRTSGTCRRPVARRRLAFPVRTLLHRVARSSDAGADLVEYALLAPVLTLVLFGIADFALLFQSYEVVSGAAREGARMGVLACEAPSPANCYSATDIQNRVAAFVDAGLPANHATPVTVAACASVDPGAGGPVFIAERVTVTYTYQFKFIGPVASLVGGSFTSVPMTAVSTMRREDQTPCP